MPGDDLEVLADARLATSRYQWWRPTHGVPIRATVGYPRFWRRTNPRLISVPQLAPHGLMDLGGNAFRAAYRQRLDDQAEEVIRVLADIVRQHPGEQLCIMCFEDVFAGEQCHRRDFADWAAERFGLEVPELPRPPGPPQARPTRAPRNGTPPPRPPQPSAPSAPSPEAKWVKRSGRPTVVHFDPECSHFKERGVIKWPPRIATPEELARCRPCTDCAP